MTDLEGMLPQIKTLKSYFGIGTSQAYNYLKSKESYEDLTNDVSEELAKREVKSRPSSPLEVSNLTNGIHDCLNYVINSIVEKASDSRGLVAFDFSVKHYGHYGNVFEKLYREFNDVSLDFDYKGFLLHHYALVDKGFSHKDAINCFMQHIVEKNIPCLREGDKKYSIPDFLEGRVELLTNEEDEYSDEDFYREDFEDDSYLDIQEDDETSRVSASGKLSFEDIQELSEHPDVESVTISPFDMQRFEAQKWLFGEGTKAIPSYFDPLIPSLNNISRESKDFLLGEDLVIHRSIYDRIERDGRLYDVHNERKIALTLLLDYHRIETGGVSMDDFMDYVVEEFNNSLSNVRGSVERLRELKAPHTMMKPTEKRVKELEYSIKVLQGNRKWLKEEVPIFLRSKIFF